MPHSFRERKYIHFPVEIIAAQMHVWALSSYYYHIKIHLRFQRESWDVEKLCNTKYLYINSWAWSSYYYHMEILILLCWELSLKEFLFSCSFSNDPKLLSCHQDTSSFSPRLEMLRVVSCAFYLESESCSLKPIQRIFFWLCDVSWCHIKIHFLFLRDLRCWGLFWISCSVVRFPMILSTRSCGGNRIQLRDRAIWSGFCTSQPEKYMLQNQIITCYRIWKKYMLQSRTNTCYRIRQIYVTEYTRSCGEKRIELGGCHLIRGFVHVRGDIGLFVHLRVRIGLLPLNWVENRTGNKKGSFTVLFVDCFIHCGSLVTCTVQVVHHLILLLVKRELRNLKNIHNPTSIILFIKVQFSEI